LLQWRALLENNIGFEVAVTTKPDLLEIGVSIESRISIVYLESHGTPLRQLKKEYPRTPIKREPFCEKLDMPTFKNLPIKWNCGPGVI